ncbi:hypothetical protein CEP53_008667 [Fusarium sp. AF-6]|nr:hypothetical protein CEP53_008667 [Fusarium sp. AF-6]
MESDDTPQSESDRARDFIAKLSGKNGFVDKEYWDELSEAGRDKFQNAIGSLQSKLEPAIKALAQSLYSSTARFVFELLQNAEDNSFVYAEGRPYISFHLSKDQLVIECNEDGFTPANLEAICSIGQSSKLATKGYIGEKGIGFKSVFMAAWKVHIQSGPYSFYFKHLPSDSGMGMITPVWQEPTEELPRHMTRMALDLHTEGDPQSILAQRHSIRQQLCKLNGNILLFMKKLKEIRIIIDENESKTSTVFTKSETDDGNTKILRTVTQEDSDSLESSSTLYHITKHQVHDLAKNENRTYSEEEDRLKEYSTAEVVLAFPLTPEHEPIIESQEVFAYLPVQVAGFSFLIQSDFMTNASREGIFTTAARNIGLRDGIAVAFIEAALEFCNHETLQYTWMKFLPNKNKVHSDFWSTLVTNIETKVRETPLIRPDSGGPLRLIMSLRNLRPALADEENNLLLRDLTPELSISRHYERSSLAILYGLGLLTFQWQEFIRMVDQDLQSSDSWIKFRVSDGSLQTRVANLLQDYYTNTKWSQTRSMIERLPIIPLQDGRWLAATSEEKVFFPDTAGLTVPEDLGFNLIESSAASQSERRKLFEILGIKSLNVSTPPQKNSLAWRDWLVQVMGVRRLLRLVNKYSSPTDLSQACYYVAEHRPEKFLAFLVHHWPKEGFIINFNTELQQKLRKIKVLCQGGQMIELEETFLPYPDLLSLSERFLAGKADFQFLQLEQPIERKDYARDWTFLTGSLGIKSTDTLVFYLGILFAFSTVQSLTEDDFRRVFELYSVIYGKYLQLPFKDSSTQIIQSAMSHSHP